MEDCVDGKNQGNECSHRRRTKWESRLSLLLLMVILGRVKSFCTQLAESKWEFLVQVIDESKADGFAVICPFEILGDGCPSENAAGYQVDPQDSLFLICGSFLGGSGDACIIDCPRRHFSVAGHLTLEGMTIRGSNETAITVDATGVFASFASQFEFNNNAHGNGGAIRATRGSDLFLESSGFTENTSKQGGAVYTEGNVRVTESTFTHNAALNGKGGAICVSFTPSAVDISKSLFEGNSAVAMGPSIFADAESVASYGNSACNNSVEQDGTYCNGIQNGTSCSPFENACTASSPSSRPRTISSLYPGNPELEQSSSPSHQPSAFNSRRPSASSIPTAHPTSMLSPHFSSGPTLSPTYSLRQAPSDPSDTTTGTPNSMQSLEPAGIPAAVPSPHPSLRRSSQASFRPTAPIINTEAAVEPAVSTVPTGAPSVGLLNSVRGKSIEPSGIALDAGPHHTDISAASSSAPCGTVSTLASNSWDLSAVPSPGQRRSTDERSTDGSLVPTSFGGDDPSPAPQQSPSPILPSTAPSSFLSRKPITDISEISHLPSSTHSLAPGESPSESVVPTSALQISMSTSRLPSSRPSCRQTVLSTVPTKAPSIIPAVEVSDDVSPVNFEHSSGVASLSPAHTLVPSQYPLPASISSDQADLTTNTFIDGPSGSSPELSTSGAPTQAHTVRPSSEQSKINTFAPSSSSSRSPSSSAPHH